MTIIIISPCLLVDTCKSRVHCEQLVGGKQWHYRQSESASARTYPNLYQLGPNKKYCMFLVNVQFLSQKRTNKLTLHTAISQLSNNCVERAHKIGVENNLYKLLQSK